MANESACKLSKLVFKARRGDATALAQLERETRPMRECVSVRFLPGQKSLLADACQEGWFGVQKAVERYDPKRGKFLTYAHHWVESRVRSFRDRSRFHVRRPQYLIDETLRLARTGGESKRLPDIQVAAAGMRQGDVSLEDEISEDRVWSDILHDESCSDPGQSAVSNDEVRFLNQFLNDRTVLTELQAHILIKRFGLEDGEDQTLGEIARPLSLSRERVRQILEKALKQLRARMGVGNVGVGVWPRAQLARPHPTPLRLQLSPSSASPKPVCRRRGRSIYQMLLICTQQQLLDLRWQ